MDYYTAKSLKYNGKLSVIIFDAGMATTLQRMHLVTLYTLLIKINHLLVSSNPTSRILIKFWK
jgi:hypothetical protein